MLRGIFFSLLSLLLTSCTGMPEGVTPVSGFELSRYLGTWHEVARLDHRFERGLTQVTASYSLREDGGVRVINRGWHAEKGEWEQAEGKAYFVTDPRTGHLNVSFFRPFYSSYVVFWLDPDYRYAAIAGFNTNYLWLLARTDQVPASVRQGFIEQAKAAGFNTQALIWLNDISPKS